MLMLTQGISGKNFKRHTQAFCQLRERFLMLFQCDASYRSQCQRVESVYLQLLLKQP